MACPQCKGITALETTTFGLATVCATCNLMWAGDTTKGVPMRIVSRLTPRNSTKGSRVAKRSRVAKSLVTPLPRSLYLPPLPEVLTLGIDPGTDTAIALVGPVGLVFVHTYHWGVDTADQVGRDIAGCIGRAVTLHGASRAIIEVLGKTRGKARGWARSWAVMSRYAGRVEQMLYTYMGTYPVELTPERWRPAVGMALNPPDELLIATAQALPWSTGPGIEKRDTICIHEAEAVLLACAWKEES